MIERAGDPDSGWLYQRQVPVDVGLRRLVGQLRIRSGEARFDPDQGEPLRLPKVGVVAVHRILAPLGMNWEIVLGHDQLTDEPMLLVTRRRRATSVVAALRTAGFEVAVHHRL